MVFLWNLSSFRTYGYRERSLLEDVKDHFQKWTQFKRLLFEIVHKTNKKCCVRYRSLHLSAHGEVSWTKVLWKCYKQKLTFTTEHNSRNNCLVFWYKNNIKFCALYLSLHPSVHREISSNLHANIPSKNSLSQGGTIQKISQIVTRTRCRRPKLQQVNLEIEIRKKIIVRKTNYPWFEASSLYLVGSAGCNLLWVAQNEWDYHRGLLSPSIDAFEWWAIL